MVRLSIEDRLKYRRTLELVGIGLVVGEAAALSVMA
jgi:hypothetical protein